MKMRAIKSLLVMTAVVGLVAKVAMAGPIPIPLPDPKIYGPVMGESTLLNRAGTTAMEIDWMVVWDPILSVYGYFYQVENRQTNQLGDNVSSFTIFVPTGSVIPGTIFIAPTGTDWDPTLTGNPPLHAVLHNIVNEITEADLGNSPNTGGLSPGVPVDTVTWTWDSSFQLEPNSETVIIGFYSPLPPVYGIGNLFDGPSGGGWGPEFNTLSQYIPVPSPEPMTAALMLMGVLGTGIFYRRRRS